MARFNVLTTLKRVLLCLLIAPAVSAATIDDAADLHTQQAQEKLELEEMKKEMDDVRKNMTETMQNMQQIGRQVEQKTRIKEFALECKEVVWELAPGIFANALTYNGSMPGPTIRVAEGDPVKIVVTNKTRQPTSLYFHGMHLPHGINGLPRRGQGVIEPGSSFTYQFIASQPGTYWYHPQVLHGDQIGRGLYGAVVVEPKSVPKTYERDIVIVLGQWNPGANKTKPALATAKPTGPQTLESTVFLANGKSAPAIAPVELKRGERIRLRVVNVATESIPLILTGHRFEVMAQNGSDSIEPHVNRDTLTINPGERYDLEFTADNPGVWSLTSMQPHQCSLNGKFPGGLAIIVRYPDAFKQ